MNISTHVPSYVYQTHQKNDQAPHANNKELNEQVNELEEQDKKVIEELKKRDADVRAHEMAHLAAAGGLARSGANYHYQTGPDGRQYAIGGDVSISVGGGNTPEEMIRNAQQVKKAATAPKDPSAQDLRVANSATLLEAKARALMSKEVQEEKMSNEDKITHEKGCIHCMFGTHENNSDALKIDA